MPENPAEPENEKALQAQLEKYKAAIESEYKLAVENAPEQVAEHTKEFFKNQAAQAAAQIAWLCMNAESESVRLSASKYIIDRGVADSASDGDPIKELLTQLTSPTTATEGSTK